MLQWIKGELKEHWVAWLGLIGLAVIGTLMMVCAGQHTTIAYIRMNTLLLCLVGWTLSWLGLYMVTTIEKKRVYYLTDKELNKPYDDWEGLYISLPCLPTIKRKKNTKNRG